MRFSNRPVHAPFAPPLSPADLAAENALAQKARDAVRAAEANLRARRHDRKLAERRLASLLIRFAAGVRAHPGYGTNSPFYHALGFVTDDSNRGGRPRKPRPNPS